MAIYQKFGLSFALALTLHLTLLGLFWLNVGSESELIKQKPLPEIIKASILDDEKIQQEAQRLKAKEESLRVTRQKQQRDLENKRKKEQNLLRDAKKKRQQEEQKIKALAKKRKDQALKEQQKRAAIKKQKALETARLAKIKKQKALKTARLNEIKAQKAAEKKRLDNQRKAADKQRELARQAEQKKQQALLKKQQQAEAAEKAARLKRQADAAKAQQAQDRQATLSATAAIQHKVDDRWIRPLSSVKGLNCTIRVKLLSSGDVMDVQVIRGSGDEIFDRSAENAVRKASPLPVPKSRALFNKHFRIFTFNFNPE